MAFDDINSGVLFKNDDKKPGSKQPDYTGKLNVDGVEHRLSAWVKEARTGRKFFSISIQIPQEKADKPQSRRKEEEFIDSDLPF